MRHYEVVETIYKRFDIADKVLFKMTSCARNWEESQSRPSLERLK